MEALHPYIGYPNEEDGPAGRRRGRQRDVHKVAITKMLIEAGANARAVDQFGSSALHDAASSYLDEAALVAVVDALIVRGAAVDGLTDDGRPPLHFAVWRGRFKIARVLVRAGASLDVADKKHRTPASMLAQQGRGDVLKGLRSEEQHPASRP
jgi:ankyrin repeat protein